LKWRERDEAGGWLARSRRGFGISALVGPVFGNLLGHSLETAPDHLAHFRAAGQFWMAAIVLAIVASFFLRETGCCRAPRPQAEPPFEPFANS
jgi:hypothetical protein